MSERYPGGFISKTAPTVTTSSAQGVWTMEQQAAYQKAGTWPFGGPFTYIEDVFSTYLYSGDGTNKTINNGIDLAGKGGLTWIKSRNNINTVDHLLFDTARGNNLKLSSNLTAGSQNQGAGCWSPTSSGFTVNNGFQPNYNGDNYVSWTFRKQAKFFDVVTWTGNGGSNRAISHSLGSVPGCYIIKATSTASDWYVYHRGADGSGGGAYINQSGILNSTAAFAGSASDGLMPSSTAIYVVDSGSTTTSTNSNGVTYVAYLFAHNAGGFGATASDNVITCGSFVDSASTPGTFVNLGWEPQFVLYKRATGGISNWYVMDTMRGFSTTTDGVTGSASILRPDSSLAESTGGGYGFPTSTGFYTGSWYGGSTWIYIAIRRGPMRTPTTASTVFDVVQQNAGQFVTTNNVVDMLIETYNLSTYNYPAVFPRLTQNYMDTNSTVAESVGGPYIGFDYNTGIEDNYVGSGLTALYYLFQRAPSFMDVVCYTGTGANTSFSHNLTVAPEMMIFKRRSSSGSWLTYHKDVGNDYSLSIESTAAKSYSPTTFLNSTSPTASVFTVGIATSINFSGSTYVAYLFASCPGVSKVGSYSGTGATQTISCGFAARFVLIKRTDSTGSWWVWDTARGMVAGTDPRLALNSTAAETNADWVYTDASGFQIVTTDATVNASGGSYIYLAIA